MLLCSWVRLEIFLDGARDGFYTFDYFRRVCREFYFLGLFLEPLVYGVVGAVLGDRRCEFKVGKLCEESCWMVSIYEIPSKRVRVAFYLVLSPFCWCFSRKAFWNFEYFILIVDLSVCRC